MEVILSSKSCVILEDNFSENLQGEILHDLIRINDSIKDDIKILDKWKKDYKTRGIPFIVTKVNRLLEKTKKVQTWLTLWVKEDAPQKNKEYNVIFDDTIIKDKS